MRALVLLAIVAAVSRASGAPPLAPGEIVIADRGTFFPSGRLYRLAPGARSPEPIPTSEPLHVPTAVAIDRDGTLVVADLRLPEPGRVVRVDPTNGAVTSIADGWPLLAPYDVVVEPTGDVLVADLDAGRRLEFLRGSLAGTGAIYRIPRASGVPVLLSHDCCTWNAAALAATPSGELAVVDMGFAVFTGDGALVLVDPHSGVQRAIATSIALLDPAGIVALATGVLVVTEATNPQLGPGAVLAIEPVTGSVTTISTGAPITDPRGIAVDAAGDFVVADSAARAVYRIAMPERTLEVLVDGDPLMVPWDVAVAP